MYISSSLVAALSGLVAVQAAAVPSKSAATAGASSTCPPYTSTSPVTTYTTTVTSSTYFISTTTIVESTPVSYTATVTAPTSTVTHFSSTLTVTQTTAVTSTSTPYGSKTITKPTPCGFTPILSEAIYHGPTSTSTYNSFVASSTSTVTLHYSYSTPTIQHTPILRTTTVSTFSSPIIVLETATAPVQPTKTVYAACGKSNVATKDPGGLVLGVMHSVYKPSQQIYKGVTKSAEECCSLCFDNPLCYGSLWTYPTRTMTEKGYEPTCNIYVAQNSTTCNPHELVFNVIPNPLGFYEHFTPAIAIAAS